MAGVKGRSHRRGVKDAKEVRVRFRPPVREKAERAASALGVSLTTYVDELVARDQLDENGRPLWWDMPVPRDQRELPLKSA